MKKVSLYIHIGAGKTGSTSIQQFLYREFNKLLEKHTLYCGLTFDTLGLDAEWKREAWVFNQSEVTNLLYCELLKYIDFAEKNNISKLILSNESFSNRIDLLIPFFNKIKEENKYELNLIFYVRTPEKWIKSAYQQWCVKHKINEGNIISAESYVDSKPYSVFLDVIKQLENNGFGENLIVRNFDKLKNNDVVCDFCDIVNIDVNKTIRINESLSQFQKAIYYFINDSIKSSALPDRGTSFLKTIAQNEKSSQYYIDNTNFKDDYFDFEDILKTKSKLNNYLESDNKFDLNFNHLIRDSNNIKNDELNLIKYATDCYMLLNSLDGVKLRDVAISLENSDIELSLQLMKIAHVLRPTGRYISGKISEYEKKENI